MIYRDLPGRGWWFIKKHKSFFVYDMSPLYCTISKEGFFYLKNNDVIVFYNTKMHLNINLLVIKNVCDKLVKK